MIYLYIKSTQLKEQKVINNINCNNFLKYNIYIYTSCRICKHLNITYIQYM